MGYEIDFLPVGDGERSGDAIAVRFGNLYGSRDEQFVMVIDGGTKDSGKHLVEHVNQYYWTNRLDLVVSTHPDADHASGLTVVLEEMDVNCFWMHQPWNHASDIQNLFRDGRITDTSLRERLRSALENAYELQKIAERKRIRIVESFSDSPEACEFPWIRVLGPSVAFYELLLPYFRDTPEAQAAGLFERVVTAAKEAIKWIAESWYIETLTDPEEPATSAENNSSVIILIEFDGHLLLFTADAGVLALTQAANLADSLGIHLPGLRFVQIPHHGSRRNVGPTILDRILGAKFQQPPDAKTAFVSVSKEGAPKHPSRKVTNAFQRRGAYNRVIATQGSAKWFHHDAPQRSGFLAAEPLPFYEEVEE